MNLNLFIVTEVPVDGDIPWDSPIESPLLLQGGEQLGAT